MKPKKRTYRIEAVVEDMEVNTVKLDEIDMKDLRIEIQELLDSGWGLRITKSLTVREVKRRKT